MNKLIILNTNCEEKIVYPIDNEILQNRFHQFFIAVSSYIELQTPEYIGLYKTIDFPIKVIKNKNNLKIHTSVKLSMIDCIYECFMQKPENLHKNKAWHVMCEDFMQINIQSHHQNYTIYAIKNNLESTKNFSFFVDYNTLQSLSAMSIAIEKFLNVNSIKQSYYNIYKYIVQKQPFESFKEAFNNSPIKEELLKQDSFLFTCLYYYHNPSYLLSHMLNDNMITPKWSQGQDFLSSFSAYFTTVEDNLAQSLIQHYEKFLLYQHLHQTLPCVITQHKKLTKI